MSLQQSVCVFVVVALALCSYAQAENLLMNFEIQNGYIFPAAVTVAEGEMVHLKLLLPMSAGDQCLYREPGSSVDVDVHLMAPEMRQRQNIDTPECGIRILHVRPTDSGFWRLTLVRGGDRIRGIAMVNVIERPSAPDDGGGPLDVSLEGITPDGTEYCYVLRNGDDRRAGTVPMHERCTLPLSELDPTGSGRWSVIAGVKGQMREMTFGISIDSKDEQVESQVHKATDYHVLSCHLRYTMLKMKFCRFERLADNFGLNVLEGVGTNQYGYYGNGFSQNECGLEINEPGSLDKGLWKCLVGYGDSSVTKVSGAILDNSDTEQPFAIINVADVNALDGTKATLQCNANKPLDYCWFRNSSGTLFTVSESLAAAESTGYWYSGVSLALGDCGITLDPVLPEHAGRWTCHVGSSMSTQLEVAGSFELRVSQSQLIGVSDNVVATEGSPLLLECVSIPQNTPLQYCRFVAPGGAAFSLNENVTVERAILDNYYSNPNHDLQTGSCSLVIRSVRTTDIGQWICAGKIDGHSQEHYAMVNVRRATPPESDTLSAASISGMAIGAAALVGAAFGFGYYRFRKRLRREVAAVNNEIEMRTVEKEPNDDTVSRASSGSDQSRLSHVQLHTTL